jgi:CelD/BcsL family acetyltransferase involved in cellulose biosynthesis
MTSRTEPLAAPGREDEVGPVLSDALFASSPRPAALVLEGVDERVPWSGLLAPRGGRRILTREGVAPVVAVPEGGLEGLLDARSGNFRRSMRRARRQVEAAGGTFAVASTPEQSRRGIEALVDLHEARWADRGGSGALDDGVIATLHAAAGAMPAGERFRLQTIEIDGKIVSSHLFLAAGDEVTYWMGGHDDGHAKQHPSMLSLLHGVDEAARHGEKRFDLGYGSHPYKYRFTDVHDELRWFALTAPGRAGAPALAELAARRAVESLAQRLPEDFVAKLRARLPGR